MGHMIREKGTATFVEVPNCANLSDEIKFLNYYSGAENIQMILEEYLNEQNEQKD